MINKIITLGKSILNQEKYYHSDTTDAEKNNMFLKSQMITPRSSKNEDNTYVFDRMAIVINFDLVNEKIEIKASEIECSKNNYAYFSAFTPNTPNGAKIFLTSNSLNKILENVFENQLLYKAKNDKRSKYLENVIPDNYWQFISSISKKFYIEPIKNENNKVSREEKINVLNSEYFDNFNKEMSILENINSTIFNKDKGLDKLPVIGTDCNNIFMITFNNQTIQEYENGKYYQSYLNICLYDFLDRFYLEKGITGNNNICHNCSKNTKLTKDSVVPWKFIVPQVLCSENLNIKYSHYTFSICRDCLVELLVGIKTLENNLSNKMFGLDNYIIPYQIENESLEYLTYKKVMNLFKDYNYPNYSQLNEISGDLGRANRRDLKFDVMFYYHNKQQFDILKLISNIEASSIIAKFNLFNEYTTKYRLNEIEILDSKKNYLGDNSLTFSTLRYSLVKSWYSTKSKLDFNNYGKKLIDLFDKFVTNGRFSELTLIKDFVTIYKGKAKNDNIEVLSAFKMVLFLSIFDELNILKHGGSMENKELTTIVQDVRLVEFLETHSGVYQNDPHKQGLFLLGTIISKIKYAQRDKASNILKKLNFEGINSRKIQSLLVTIDDFYQIYKKNIFLQESLWGCIYDRLQEIEKSSLTSEEIAFYILSGVSYQDYLGIIAGIDKKNETNQGEENENQKQ